MLLDQVVPWGRSLHEYELMFGLSAGDKMGRILGCGDGPASFNCEMTATGYHVVSVDPIYAFSRGDIQQRVEETYETIISQVKLNPHRYRWNYFSDADDLGRARLEAMQQFLEDYEAGLTQDRYLPGALPELSFANNAFDLALCSHLLFLYSEQLSLDFHIASIEELLRVTEETRIFPLLGLNCLISPHLGPVMAHFEATRHNVQIEPVDYEFQVGGNQMLKITRGQ